MNTVAKYTCQTNKGGTIIPLKDSKKELPLLPLLTIFPVSVIFLTCNVCGKKTKSSSQNNISRIITHIS